MGCIKLDILEKQLSTKKALTPKNSVTTLRNGYMFGFNGMEKDPEITGQEGSHYTAKFWEYDTRIGRRWNVDPVVKPWESSYATFANNPVFMVDPNGDNANPIYTVNGKYLGTDSEGEIGEAIIMEEDDFEQGMLHEDAEEKGKYFSNLNNLERHYFMETGYGDWRVRQYEAKKKLEERENMFETAPLVLESQATTQSVNVGFAFGGGYQLELGMITDSRGYYKFYFSHGPTIGVGASISYQESNINTVDGKPFLLEMYEGESTGYTGGLFIVGASHSGDISEESSAKSGWFGNYGETYIEKTNSVGVSPKGVEAGFWWSKNETVFIEKTEEEVDE